jgi:hypothetical protein
MKPKLLLALTALLALADVGHAQSTAFTYQGVIRVSGVPYTGTGQFKFALINPTDGSAVWSNDGSHLDGTEPDTSVSTGVTNGVIAVALGDAGLMSPFATGLFETYGNLALRIWFSDGANGFHQMTPDQRLTAAPYALAANISAGSVAGDRLAPAGVDYTRLSIGGAPAPGQVLGFDGLGFSWQTAGSGGGSSPWLSNATNIFYNAGRVGVGTASPGAPMELWGNWDPGDVATLNLRGGKPTLSWETDFSIGASSRTYSWILHEGPDGPGNLGFYQRNHNVFALPGPWEQVMSLRPDRTLSFGASLRQMIHLWSTTYGIGVQDFTLYQRTDGGFAWYRGGTHNNAALNAGGGQTLMTLDEANGLFVSGRASVCVLTIRGGCDIAEPFPMKEAELAKGSVVVIDEDHPGQLKLSTQAYDARVAGIISGANGVNAGIALHQEGIMDGGQNVALSGRVYVQADATFGAIKPGDMLTTSDTAGHAMKVTEHARAQGAILGKAMSSLTAGKGMVLVLVTLQ